MSVDANVRDLLAAVLEAIDLPHPATEGGAEVYDRIRNERATHVAVALRSVLDDKPLMDIEWTTAYLREQLAKHPATGYVTVVQAHARLAEGKSWSEAVALPTGEDRCGKCRTPFDPTDTRFDGRGRHGDAPWCRRCVDRCHESTDAFHICPVCDPKQHEGGDQ